MQKLLYKSLLFAIILFVVSYLFSMLVGMKYEKNNFTKTKWVISLNGKKNDIVFVGSSRIANMIDVSLFDKKTKHHSINIATSGAGFAENFIMLQTYLSKNVATQTLVLQFDAYATYDSLKVPNFIAKRDPLLFKRFEMKDLISKSFSEKVFSEYCTVNEFFILKYLPYYSYVLYNQKFTFLRILKQGEGSNVYEIDTNNGTWMIDKKNDPKDFKVRAGDDILYRYNLTYLVKILEYCTRNNIKVLLITPPYYKQLKEKSLLFKKTLNDLKAIYCFKYYDFSNMPDWNNASYFVDHIHTNKDGSVLFTQMLADSVLKDGDFLKHKEVL